MNQNSIVSPAKSQKSLVVCGSLHLDVVVDAPHLPRIDETVTGSSVNYICGGKGGNQAVAAALNGASTAFVGCTGDDEFGDRLTAHLRRNNIDCSSLQKTSGASGMSVAIVDSNGDYGAVIVSASNLSINSHSFEFPESTGLLMLQNEIPDSVNSELAQRANKLKIPVMFNAAPFRTISVRLEPLIDILILNRVEAEQFFAAHFASISDVVTALNTTESSINTIIVTLAEGGLVYRDNTGHVENKSAYPVDVISTHGAGDMFCGALASRIIAGATLNAALDYAMAAAAWHVSATLAERSKIDIQAINCLLAKNA